jgi:hypothetical protein
MFFGLERNLKKGLLSALLDLFRQAGYSDGYAVTCL